jgi:hypothetical protein
MDLTRANLAGKAAGIFMLMLLFGRAVIHPAFEAGEIFCGPDAVRHAAIMRRAGQAIQPKSPPRSTSSYPNAGNRGLSDRALLISCIAEVSGTRDARFGRQLWRRAGRHHANGVVSWSS